MSSKESKAGRGVPYLAYMFGADINLQALRLTAWRHGVPTGKKATRSGDWSLKGWCSHPRFQTPSDGLAETYSFHEASIIKEIAAAAFGDVLQAFIVAMVLFLEWPTKVSMEHFWPLQKEPLGDRPYLNVWLMLDHHANCTVILVTRHVELTLPAPRFQKSSMAPSHNHNQDHQQSLVAEIFSIYALERLVVHHGPRLHLQSNVCHRGRPANSWDTAKTG
ncbi:hypothetical protein EDD22DRAFT_842504 [Suillus occidentalis]|nr:hypothetical protein EDD22DRAFT_842504 [Suillus occidentalis]